MNALCDDKFSTRKQKMFEKLWGALDKDGLGQCKGSDICEVIKNEEMGVRLLDNFKHTQGGQKDGFVTKDEFESMMRELST